MMRIKYLILTLCLMIGVAAVIVPTSVGAANATDTACKVDPNSPLCVNETSQTLPDLIKKIVQGLLFVLGTVAVIVIIFAGIFYTTSSGDPKMVEKAKNTLMYAVIGLIVAVLSYAIVGYVVGMFPSTAQPAPAVTTPATGTPAATPTTPAAPAATP